MNPHFAILAPGGMIVPAVLCDNGNQYAQMAPRKLVLEYPKFPLADSTIVISGDQKFFKGRGNALFQGIKVDGEQKVPEQDFFERDGDWWKRAPFNRLNQCSLSRWILSGLFDVTIREENLHMYAPHRVGSVYLSGESQMELKQDGAVNIQQEAGAKLLLLVSPGPLWKHRSMFVATQPFSPHELDYLKESRIQLSLKSDDKSLTIQSTIFFPSQYVNHPRVSKGLHFRQQIMSYTPSSQNVYVGSLNMSVQNDQGEWIRGVEQASPVNAEIARVPEYLKEAVHKVLGTWRYFCNNETLAMGHSAASFCGFEPKKISFYCQTRAGGWQVMET